MYCHRMFKRSLLIATGAGLAGIAPSLVTPRSDIFVVWITKKPEEIFGKELTKGVKQHPNHLIYDTKERGRSDFVHLCVQCGLRFRAEAAFIVSNKVYYIFTRILID